MYSMTAAASPRTCAPVIRNSTAALQRKDTPEPMATSVSMFGARFSSPFAPEMKNF